MAGQFGTFMKTTDGGQSWSIFYNSYVLGSNFPDFNRGDFFDAHFFNQNTGIIIGSFGSIFMTSNAGSNFVTFDSIPGSFVNTDWNHIFFLNSNTGYIAGNNGKLLKTANGGSNWALVTSISSANHFDIWSPDGTLIIVSSAGGNIQRSTDGGISWQTINTGSSVNLQRLCFTSNDTGIVCGNSGSVRLTTDGGLNWTNINTGLAANNNFIDLDYKINGSNKEFYLTGNAQYIYKTTNFGSSWDTLGIWGANQTNMGIFHRYISTELMGGDSLLTVGTFGLINKRNSITDRTLYTTFVKFGAANVNDIWVQNGKILAVGNPTITGTTFDQILYSSNSGNNWVASNVGSSTSGFNSISMPNSNTGYAAGPNGKIIKTVNGGISWDSLISPTTNWLHKVDFIDVNTGWIFTDQGTIFKTTDSGLNWIQQNSTVTTGFYGMDADMLDASTGWFAGNSVGLPPPGYVYKTTNGGTNWVQQYYSTLGHGPLSIKMVDNNTGYFGGALILRKTTNGGANWDSLAIPLLNYQIVGMDFINAQTGITLGLFYTLRTTSGGASWNIDYLGGIAGWNSSPCKIKMVSQDTAYACGSQAGVFKYSQGPIGIIEWQNGVPEKFELFQNYPNPFNPSTTIKFTIPKAGNVTLKLYDITGQEVTTIINNIGLNPGTITHQFVGSEYSSGVYFYSLYVDGDLIDSKKMMLVK